MCREFSCRMVLPSFTEFYRGLLGFTGFHNRSLGEAYWVLLGFPRLLLIVMAFHVFLMGSIGFQRILLGLNVFFSVSSMGFKGFSWTPLGCAVFFWVLTGFPGFYRAFWGVY